MVELVVDASNQTTWLEWELAMAGIDCVLTHNDNYGFEPPHLIVNGVPLDYERSLKWIKERVSNE